LEYSRRTDSKKKLRLSLEGLAEKKQKELRQQEIQKERLLDLYQNGLLSRAEIEIRVEKIRLKIRTIQQECQLLEQEKQQEFKQLKIIEQFETFKNKLNLNVDRLTFDQRKDLVRLLVRDIEVDTLSQQIIIHHSLPIP